MNCEYSIRYILANNISNFFTLLIMIRLVNLVLRDDTILID